MNQPIRPSITDLMANNALITAAISRGVRDAVLKRIQAGKPVAAWRDGRPVWLSPEEALALLNHSESAPTDSRSQE